MFQPTISDYFRNNIYTYLIDMNKFIYCLIILFWGINSIIAQESPKNGANLNPGFIIGFSYGYGFPDGNLKTRFGNNFNIGISPHFYFNNSNFYAGLDASYLFGTDVKTNPLTNLTDINGQLISVDRSYASLTLDERGFLVGLNIGKIIPFNQNKRSGLKVQAGGYIFRHWIHFQKDFGILPQLEGEYLKGYDRLTGGITLNEFIGYQYLKKNSKINFYIGLDMYQGFTKSLRKYNYDLADYDLDNRNDILWGIKAGWILPIYIENHPEEIYY